jgi:hypothetical protein
MNIMLGQQIGPKLLESLGLPKHTISFTLRVRVGEVVTVECVYAPEGDVYASELAEYFLVERQSPRVAQPHPAEVLGYDVWLQQRNEAAHQQLMARCVGIDYGN